MAELHDSITRDCSFLDTKEGKHYFIILEHGEEVYQSDLYDTQEDCCIAGMDMLSFLHINKPIQNNRVTE